MRPRPLRLRPATARPSHRALRAVAILGLALWGAGGSGGCALGGPPQLGPEPVELSDGARAVYARQHLENARRLRAQGRLDAAERVARRGIALRPDDPRLDSDLHGLLADLLAEQGRPDEAKAQRAIAAERAPSRPPIPATPLTRDGWRGGDGVLVLLDRPDDAGVAPGRIPAGWPEDAATARLRARIEIRLPRASVAIAPGPDTAHGTAAASAWMAARAERAVVALRIERAFCTHTIKDGPFALAQLRWATRPGSLATSPAIAKQIVPNPPDPGSADCADEAIDRALEQVLADLPPAQAAPDGDLALDASAARALLPGLGVRIAVELEEGRRMMAAGQLALAAAAFERAAAIDPTDEAVRSHQREAAAALALARALSPTTPSDDVHRSPADVAEIGVLAPQLTASQRAQLESQLAGEREIRRQLLAALAHLGSEGDALDPAILAALRDSRIDDPDARGPRLARSRSPGEVEARVLFAPDGEILARYFFDASRDEHPVLSEEDVDHDGQADRWVAYRGTARSEVWERGRPGEPSLYMVYAQNAQADARPERLEIDADRDGSAERVFEYEDGRLVAEQRDTNGDGRYDRADFFDADGHVARSDEDVDRDGSIDVSTHYRAGRIVQREILNPDVAIALSEDPATVGTANPN